MTTTTYTTTLADLADRLGNDLADYEGFGPGTTVTIHANGQALALDGGVSVELENDHAAVRAAYRVELWPMSAIATYEMTYDDGRTSTAEVRASGEGWQLVDVDGGHHVYAEGDADSYDAACVAALAAATADRCRTGEVEEA